MSDDLTIRAIGWRNGRQTGMSSVALICRLMGWPIDPADRRRYPLDPSDFRRCHLMLSQLPELRARLGEAADLCNEWAALIGAWEELEALYHDEVKNETGRAPKLYARMKTLLASASSSAAAS